MKFITGTLKKNKKQSVAIMRTGDAQTRIDVALTTK